MLDTEPKPYSHLFIELLLQTCSCLIPILQMGTLIPRESKHLAQGSMDYK